MISTANIRHCALVILLTARLLLAQPAPDSKPPANETEALVKQAQKLNSEGKQGEALSAYRKALAMSPDNFDAHLGAGIVLDLQGEYGEARRHLAKAIDVAPADAKDRALRTMAMSYAFEQKAHEAAKFEKQAFEARMAKQDFTGAAGIANELARIYLECSDLDNAHQWYKTGYDTALHKTDLKETDKSLWAFRWEHAQARIAARRGQREEAQKHITAAKTALDKAANPDQAVFFPYLTGYVAFYGGDYKTAIADLQKANQSDPFILSLLAQAYEKSGEQGQATETYRKILASNGHTPTNAFARPLARKKLASAQ
jgi:tetratricopeptide (TPR) repeat protein